MKNNNVFFGIVVLLLLAASCKKDNNSVDYSVIDNEKIEINKALVLSQAYNDTLEMVFDTVKVPKNNHYCLMYDTLYHHSDSMFSVHYTMFSDEMYKNGMMMYNYSPSGSMIQGGMMNSGTMDMNHMMNDTAIVGGYYRNMHQLHNDHQIFHSGIYN